MEGPAVNHIICYTSSDMFWFLLLMVVMMMMFVVLVMVMMVSQVLWVAVEVKDGNRREQLVRLQRRLQWLRRQRQQLLGPLDSLWLLLLLLAVQLR
jgi:hypothetical protein